MKDVDLSNADNVGWVYIVANEHIPDKVKVGMTCRALKERMNELNGTGVPGTNDLVYAALVPNPEQVERAVHEKLDHHKVPGGTSTEWFSVSPIEACNAIKEIAPEI